MNKEDTVWREAIKSGQEFLSRFAYRGLEQLVICNLRGAFNLEAFLKVDTSPLKGLHNM